MVEDDSRFQRQLVFSQPPGSSAAELTRSHDGAAQNEHLQWRLEPFRVVNHPQPAAELFDSLLHQYARNIQGVRERPRTLAGHARRRTVRAGQGTAAGGHVDQQHAVAEPMQHPSRLWPDSEQDEPGVDYGLRGFTRSSLSPLSPSYSPWSAYLPSYSPSSNQYSPIAYTTSAPNYSPPDYVPTSPPRYTSAAPPRYAPTSGTMGPLASSAGEHRSQLYSRSTVDYFRLLSRGSDSHHRRRMREDRDRFRASAAARAGAEARAAAQRSRSREGSNASPPRPCPGISPCSFLRPGMTFEGVQSSQEEVPSSAKEWSVTVEITQMSVDNGMLGGTMTARNIPHQPGSVMTYFTGEIVDMSNYNFLSPEHATDECMDWNHWSQFPAFCAMSRGRLPALGDLTLQEVDASGFVFMRWKERAFVSKLQACNSSHASLTITGFYYICLERATGKVLGSYCDPAKGMQGEWSHFSQKLLLKPSSQKNSGYSFGTVSFS